MRVLIIFLLFVASAGMATFEYYNGRYWLMSPAERVDMKWANEIAHIESKSKQMKTAFQLLKDVKVSTTDPQFKELIDQSHPPFRKSAKGVYTMHVQISPWMEEMQYGYIITHQLTDAEGNAVTEFALNIVIGYLW